MLESNRGTLRRRIASTFRFDAGCLDDARELFDFGAHEFAEDQKFIWPPFTCMVCPLMKLAPGPHRKRTVVAISCASP